MNFVSFDLMLERAYLMRGYWLRVPARFVAKDLSMHIEGSKTQRRVFLRASGLEEALACQTPACLAGWLLTMPEVPRREARALSRASATTLVFNELIPWLGLTNSEATDLFNSRRPHETGTDWLVALKRIDAWIARLEATWKACAEWK